MLICELSPQYYYEIRRSICFVIYMKFSYFPGSNEHLALVNAMFETNPLNKPNVDQVVKAFVQPVEIVYDSVRFDLFLIFTYKYSDNSYISMHNLYQSDVK